jgi:hypothetical protein
MMHTHDTNETFVVIAGTWMFEWEGDQGNDHVILNERDIVSFEPGSQRRFECVSAPDGAEKGMILGVIGGDTPAAEFSPESIEKMRAAGRRVLTGIDRENARRRRRRSAGGGIAATTGQVAACSKTGRSSG